MTDFFMKLAQTFGVLLIPGCLVFLISPKAGLITLGALIAAALTCVLIAGISAIWED